MRILLMITACVMLIGGAGAFYLMSDPETKTQLPAFVSAPAQVVPEKVNVYVPAGAISAGVILKPEHLSRVSLEPMDVSDEMIEADPEGQALLLGSVARQTLAKGVPIARSAVVQPGDRGFLAAVLPKGKRAISIAISETGGISGLVLPGDRVDLILTYSLSGDALDGRRDVRASETVMKNIRVLALDQRVGKGEQPAAGAPDVIASTATLQVSPREAEMATLASTLGDLSLVLNSVHDGGDVVAREAEVEAAEFTRTTGVEQKPRSLTLDSDVTSLLQRQRAQAEPAESLASTPDTPVDRLQRIQIVRGTSSGGIDLADQSPVSERRDLVASDTAGGPIEVDPNQ